MARTSNQKLKLLYLLKIFMEKTDETHSLTMADIISSLSSYGIKAERKSLYDDIELLRQYGVDIIGCSEGKTYHYHIGNRQFELAELKLLVDSVQSAKFITAKKSRELIRKIISLASTHEAAQLDRQVYMASRVKTDNEKIYYNVDLIHHAIHINSQISFQYFQWDVNKQPVLKKQGDFYTASPWALTWDDENYYMIAYDSSGIIKHFRVDKMLNIFLNEKEREGQKIFTQQFDMSLYSKKIFGMFTGEETLVTLRCRNTMAGVIIDRFGSEPVFFPDGPDHFLIKVKVAVSRQFIAWVISLGEDVSITAPENLLEQMKQETRRLMRQYL